MAQRAAHSDHALTDGPTAPGTPPPDKPHSRFSIAPRLWELCESSEFIGSWKALAEWASEPNPFYEHWYLLPSLRAFDRDGQVHMLCFEVDGVLAGIMPLTRSHDYYGNPVPHVGNWLHANAFLGTPLVARNFEQAFWRTLLDWADRNCGFALFQHLSQVPLSGPLYTALKQVLAEQDRAHALVGQEERAMLASRLTPEDYLEAALSTKKRKELRRQHRRLAEEGKLEVVRQQGKDGLVEWISRFLQLEASGWKGKAGSALAINPETALLFAEALHGAAKAHKLERISLELDGEPIAMLANFLSAPGAFSFKTAFDERFSRFSPGVLLQRENLDLLNRSEIVWCDSCASEDHPMIDHFWRERRMVGKINIALGGSLRRAAFRLLTRVEMRGKETKLP